MKISNSSRLNFSMLASAMAAAVFGGTSMGDEPTLNEDRQVVVLVQTDRDKKEVTARLTKDGEEKSQLPKFWLGVGLKEVTGDLAEYLGRDGGVMVASVMPDGPAAKADLRKGDILLSVDGKQLTSPSTLQDVLKGLPAPKEGAAMGALKVVLLRKGQELTVELTPVERPKELTLKKTPSGGIQKDLDTATTIIGDLTGKSAEELRQLVEKHASSKEGATFFRFGTPSPMWWRGDGKSVPIEGNVNATIVCEEDGKKTEVTIERRKDGPAKIKVKEGDETKEYTDKQIAELPEKIQQLVRPMLHSSNRFEFRMGFDRSEEKQGDAKKNDGGSADKKSTENRTERRSRIEFFNTDDLTKLYHGRDMAEHLRKAAEEFAKNYKDSAKWAADAAAMPTEMKELREQVEKLREIGRAHV